MHRHRPLKERGPEAASTGSDLAAKVARIDALLRWELVNHPPATQRPVAD